MAVTYARLRQTLLLQPSRAILQRARRQKGTHQTAICRVGLRILAPCGASHVDGRPPKYDTTHNMFGYVIVQLTRYTSMHKMTPTDRHTLEPQKATLSVPLGWQGCVHTLSTIGFKQRCHYTAQWPAMQRCMSPRLVTCPLPDRCQSTAAIRADRPKHALCYQRVTGRSGTKAHAALIISVVASGVCWGKRHTLLSVGATRLHNTCRIHRVPCHAVSHRPTLHAMPCPACWWWPRKAARQQQGASKLCCACMWETRTPVLQSAAAEQKRCTHHFA